MADESRFIRFSCGQCQKAMKAPPEYAGRRVTCQGCGSKLRVPGAFDVYEQSFFEQDDEMVPALVNPRPVSEAKPQTVAPPAKDRSQYRGCVSSAFLWMALLWSIFTLFNCFMSVMNDVNRVNTGVAPAEEIGLRVAITVVMWGAIWFFPWLGAVVFSFVTKKN